MTDKVKLRRKVFAEVARFAYEQCAPEELEKEKAARRPEPSLKKEELYTLKYK